jgi:predicted alpha-1,2-mannosidase
MVLKKVLLLLCLVLSAASVYSQNAKYINPFIGTAVEREGRTYPGAVSPWGMVSVSPYYVKFISPNQKDPLVGRTDHISGFGHIHLSGVGCHDLFGSILLMPTTGKLEVAENLIKSKYKDEYAEAGYYRTFLSKYNVQAEMSSTTRTGISRYTFPQGNSNIIIDLTRKSNRRSGAGYVKIISDTEIEGYKTEGRFCGGNELYNIYFVMQFSKPALNTGVWSRNGINSSRLKEISGRSVGAYLQYQTFANEPIEVRVGISYVSIANARLNLQAEQRNKGFDNIKREAFANWDNQLSRVKVEGGTEEDKGIFYTGLYHMLLHPNVYSDVNGEYPAMGTRAVKTAEGYTRYTVYSLWDTYRNLHPFLTLVYPERQLDMVKTMIEQYKESGWLPKWEHVGYETRLMNGDPAIPVIADTYLKGIRDFDIELAYEAMKKSATFTEGTNPIRPGLKSYLKYGYIPNDDKGEPLWGSVSTTLEYTYADWCLAQIAKALDKERDYKEFIRRSQFYKNLFDPQTKFLRPRLANGNWYSPFDPTTTNGELDWDYSGGPGYVEGSAWNYLFFVPNDIEGLKELIGGDRLFVNRLQESFDKQHFTLKNEPDMAYPYLFNYIKGEEWRTQQTTRQLIRKDFDTSHKGLPGNDDSGTTSCWLVFSMIGLYTDCPGTDRYQITSPVFSKIRIKLDPKFYAGKEFIIESNNSSSNEIYIQSISLNGRSLDRPYLTHQEITNGGKVSYAMADKTPHSSQIDASRVQIKRRSSLN